MPKISVVMSVYNGERYLKQAIDSILSQTFTDFEFILIEDCSTDSTAQILQNYTDPRLKIHYNPKNIGLTKSLNLGLNMAQGDYIARQDADDISLPTRLAEQAAFLDAHPAVVLVSGNIEQIDADGNTIGLLNRAALPQLVRWYMLFYNHVSGHSQVLFRRDAALKVGGYNENRPYSQDYELWLKLLREGEIAMLPRTWLKRRTHGENISTQKFAHQEQLSLADSQHEISRWIGHELALETVAKLRGFWLEPFPHFDEAGQIYMLLKEIYMAFLTSPPHPLSVNREGEQITPLRLRGGAGGGVKIIISECFFRWARSVSLRKHPAAKFKLWFYAWKALKFPHPQE